MYNLTCTGGNWRIRKTVDESGDYPFPTYDIIAVHEYGPECIGTAYQHPGNARLFACSSRMLEYLIDYLKTRITGIVVRKEFFASNPTLVNLIEEASGLPIEEALKDN